MYSGGSHQTIKTSADVFGSQGPFSYYFSGSLGENNLGIENPTSSASPIHDHTRQGDAFGLMSYIINPLTRVSLMFGTTSNQFQIPNSPGLPTAFTLNGNTTFDSSQLNEDTVRAQRVRGRRPARYKRRRAGLSGRALYALFAHAIQSGPGGRPAVQRRGGE